MMRKFLHPPPHQPHTGGQGWGVAQWLSLQLCDLSRRKRNLLVGNTGRPARNALAPLTLRTGWQGSLGSEKGAIALEGQRRVPKEGGPLNEVGM